ncbi:MAG: hypothetical protein P1P64_02225 [Treponemataceae bacterium]
MKKNFIFVVFIFCLLTLLISFDFPSDFQEPKNFFGQKVFKMDSEFDLAFENGIVLDNVNNVKVSEVGEKILSIEQSNSLNSFPSALRNAMILLHDNGFQTFYGNLADVAIFENKKTFLKGETLGQTEYLTNEKHAPLIFKIVDVKEGSKNFVNPLLLLPELVDKRPFFVRSVFLLNSEGQKIVLGAKSNVPSGKYKLFLEGFDRADNSQSQLAPFEINASLSGNNIANITMQTMYVQNGNIFLKENFSLAEMYQTPQAYYLCEVLLSLGNAKLNISVRDFSKNIAEYSYDLLIN